MIVAIENEAFPRPWPAAIYNEELRRETTWLDVAQGPGGEVLAFLCAWRILDACHLLRIATREAARGQGIGRALVERLIAAATAVGCTHIELEVASRNAGALALYRGLGFAEVGRRPKYYRDPIDDAILMDLPLATLGERGARDG
ncbi:MAG: ribosomal protein S18-alanine N-acetyltransferase [Myxococcales bacterium]|nr:ribosomal protein S18-alanine N-acetyltransferase [Myxococcales bacterium]